MQAVSRKTLGAGIESGLEHTIAERDDIREELAETRAAQAKMAGEY